VISGTMPKRQQNFHTLAFGVMCLLLGGFALLSGHFLLSDGEARPAKGLLGSSLVFVAVACFGLGMLVWFRRRIVNVFSYDGCALRFSTLGRAEMQTRDLSEIADLREWRGRGGPLGFRLCFRDGQKVYLQYGVVNAAAAAEQMRRDLRV
jgi:hypothetical protein